MNRTNSDARNIILVLPEIIFVLLIVVEIIAVVFIVVVSIVVSILDLAVLDIASGGLNVPPRLVRERAA
jgi:hypothetical protein